MRRPRLPTSLTARLALSVVLLVALVSLVISALTTAATSDFLTGQLDDKLEAAHERSLEALRLGPRPEPPSDGQGAGPPPGGREARGQDVGTLLAYQLDGEADGLLIGPAGTPEPLAADDLAVVAGLEEGGPRTVELPGAGEYRVRVGGSEGLVLVTGLPTASVDEAVASLVRWELLFSTLGVVAAGALAVLVVRRQIRPLREVAATARRVAATDLTSGDVGVTARVPERLVDSRTEVGEVAAGLNTMLGHVESALAERHRSEQQVRQFVADASHELRTPLATISGYAELGLRDGDEQTLLHAMRKIQGESGRMTSLVEDLLLLARLDAGRPLARAEVDVTRLVLECVEDARVTGPDHRWLLELPDEGVTVTGDELRLRQVLVNLLGNARRHTPPGTTVVSAVERQPGEVLVTVTDDGPGIDPELLPDVFRRFTRGDAARSREASGAGLGLALSRAIARAHDGDLTVTSEPGRTRFVLSLPA